MSLERILTAALLASAGLFVLIAASVLVGRIAVDRRRTPAGSPEQAARIAARADRGSGRGGRWRRAGALVELGRSASPHATAEIFRRALTDPDPEIRGAAVRGLAPLATERPWALELIVETLESGAVPRSRVAAHLDHLAPCAQDALVRLTSQDDPQVRYWAATLLARYEETGTERLTEMLADTDASVRRAAVEALGVRGERDALPRVLELLDDETMFVRAHACRAAGRLGGHAVAARLVPLLGDGEWWVRAAAKDTLRSFGEEALESLLPVLRSDDRFARNSAAEVLQDIGVLDRLAASFPSAPLVADIYAAGETGLRRASDDRLGGRGAAEHAHEEKAA